MPLGFRPKSRLAGECRSRMRAWDRCWEHSPSMPNLPKRWDTSPAAQRLTRTALVLSEGSICRLRTIFAAQFIIVAARGGRYRPGTQPITDSTPANYSAEPPPDPDREHEHVTNETSAKNAPIKMRTQRMLPRVFMIPGAPPLGLCRLEVQ
jgi:hypothetical protein